MICLRNISVDTLHKGDTDDDDDDDDDNNPYVTSLTSQEFYIPAGWME
jgi:hypothetical protein